MFSILRCGSSPSLQADLEEVEDGSPPYLPTTLRAYLEEIEKVDELKSGDGTKQILQILADLIRQVCILWALEHGNHSIGMERLARLASMESSGKVWRDGKGGNCDESITTDGNAWQRMANVEV
jgi:hypothetical protein